LYQRTDTVHELADGRFVATERDRHPDAVAEAFRQRITTLELQQVMSIQAFATSNLWRMFSIVNSSMRVGRCQEADRDIGKGRAPTGGYHGWRRCGLQPTHER
jgi:hypothetical protein